MAKKLKLFIVFNFIIVISTIIITIIDVIHGTNGGQTNFNVQGWNYFMPFTINSNVLMAIASAIALVKIFRHRSQSPDDIKIYSRKFTNFYYMAAVSLNLTAATVALFLAPLRFIEGENGFTMFMNDMFFFHLVNPILATYSLLFLLNGARINKTSRLLCFIPPVIYSAVYSTHVLILHDWSDFYNFTFGGNYLLAMVSASANIAAIYVIATIIAKSYNDRISIKTFPTIILPKSK